MKRAVVTAVLFLGAVAALGGCPMYSHADGNCFRDSECEPGYFCDNRSGACLSVAGPLCARPSDCGRTETCDQTGHCASGDCTFNGCVSGYRCDPSSQIWVCVLEGASGAAGADNGAGEGEGGASATSVAGAGQANGG